MYQKKVVSVVLLVVMVAFLGSCGMSGRYTLNHPPKGFVAMFNGNDLTGWKIHEGLPGHGIAGKWTVEDGVIVGEQDPPGKGGFLTTLRKFRDLEIILETKIDWPFDSGVFLRVGPDGKSHQVNLDYRPNGQIGKIYCPWTTGSVHECPEGIKYFKKDEWNQVRIICRGEPARIRVWLNGTLITDFQHTAETTAGIPEEGTVALQIHPGGDYEESKVRFRNIFIREIPRGKALFNGKDLTGWQWIGKRRSYWKVKKGALYTNGGGHGWLSTAREYDDFELDLEFRIQPGGNSGVFVRAPHKGLPWVHGMEIQVLDDYAERWAMLKPWQFTGSIYEVQAPAKRVTKKAGEWQKMTIVCDGPRVKVILNDVPIVDTNLEEHTDKLQKHPGIKRRKGYIGLQDHGSPIEYRNIRITELK